MAVMVRDRGDLGIAVKHHEIAGLGNPVGVDHNDVALREFRAQAVAVDREAISARPEARETGFLDRYPTSGEWCDSTHFAPTRRDGIQSRCEGQSRSSGPRSSSS